MRNNGENLTGPKLDKPGKGLPFIESVVVRFYIGPFVSKRFSPQQNTATFQKLNEKIIAELDRVEASLLEEKVLVPKLKTIEDSSRFWSVAETLEHIEIVGRNIIEVIESLASGQTPKGKVDIAAYKPKGIHSGKECREVFVCFHKEILSRLENTKIPSGGEKLFHPWMGPMNALQWQWLLAGHSGIHLAQIRHIKKGLDLG